VKIAIRRILVTLAWVGLLLSHRVFADDWGTPQGSSAIPGAIIPQNQKSNQPISSGVPDDNLSVVGDRQTPIGGVFGDSPPAACEFCGGGGCAPPTWTAEASVGVMSMSRAANQRLGANSLPAGPLNAGTITVTNSNGVTTSNNFIQYINDAVQTSALEVHTPGIDVSPMLGLSISRFLGRDGEARDMFLELAFNGLGSFSEVASAAQGSTIPFYNTTPVTQTIPAPPPIAEFFYGSLISPFPFFLPINGNQAQVIAPTFSLLGENYDKAFNRSDAMSTTYSASYNEFELNYRIVGHNQPDQLVMNPNGRWYRECESGYYHSYFFGLKSMIINEDFNFSSAGSEFSAVANPDGSYSPGALLFTHQGSYAVKTYNTLLGLQTGGKLEYRFCRWTFDGHGNAGMFMNFAHQDSRIQTSFGGPSLPTLSDGSTVLNTDNAFGVSNNVVAFAGGFGVTGSYKFRPNLVGRVSYELNWVGDIARAPEQMVFSSVPENARDLINTHGSVFYNGVNFAVDFEW